MKVNFQELNALKTALQKLQNTSLPFKQKYWLSKLATSVEKNVEFYSTSLRSIIDTYAKKDEEGNFVYTDETQQSVAIQDGKIADCNKAFADLDLVEYELCEAHLDEAVFMELNTDLTYAEIAVIGKFFEEN